MKKQEFIDVIAQKSGLSKADCDKALKAVLEAVTEVVAAGDEISFQGFGKFSRKDKKATTARNPQTGETIEVAAKKAPVFAASSAFKATVNA